MKQDLVRIGNLYVVREGSIHLVDGAEAVVPLPILKMQMKFTCDPKLKFSPDVRTDPERPDYYEFLVNPIVGPPCIVQGSFSGYRGDGRIINLHWSFSSYRGGPDNRYAFVHYLFSTKDIEGMDFDLPEVRAEQQAHLEAFVGREEWLQRLSDWVSGSSGYLLLLGPPGQGKSALLSRFAASSGAGCILHLANSHRNPRRFLQYLIWQAEKAVGSQPGAAVSQGDMETLRHELVGALERVRERHGRALMVIDALDTLDSPRSHLQFLPEALPAGVLAVLSTRPDMALVGSLHMRLRQLETMSLPPLGPSDVRPFVERQLGALIPPPALYAIVDESALLSHTGGNALFLRLALRRLQEALRTSRGALPVLDVRRLPNTSDAVFDDLYQDFKGPLLHVLAEAREPASVPMLRGVLNAYGSPVSLEETRQLVLNLSVCLLSFDGDRFLLFHEGFVDYLRSKVLGDDGQARVHQAWATWLGAPRQEALPYRLRHLSAHLAAWWRLSDDAEALRLLTALLTDFAFLQAKIDNGLTFDLLADYGRVTPYLRPAEEPRPTVTEGNAAAQLARLRSSVQGPGSPLQEALVVGFEDEPAADGPAPPTSPLETFEAFISTHSHLLAAGVETAVVLARNDASEGPLAERAQALVESLRRPWVSRDPRPPPYPLPPVCQATLKGHDGAALGVTADARRVVSCGRDGTARVWDTSGACTAILRGHRGEVNRVALRQETLLTAGNDKTLGVWNLADGTLRHRLEGHEDHVVDVAMDGDARLAVSASWDESLRVWDVVSGRQLRVLSGHDGAVFAVALTPDGRLAVSAGEDGTVRVWDVSAGTCLRRLEGHEDRITSVALRSDGTLALSGSYDQTARLWNLTQAACLRVLTGHTAAVTHLSATPSLRTALTASLDRSLRVWDVASGRERRLLDDHTDAVTGAWLAADGGRAVSSGWDAVRLWNLATGLSPRRLPRHQTVVSRVAASADGGRVISASYDQTLRVWDNGDCRHVLSGHTRQVWSAVWTGAHAVASAGGDAEVRLWSVQDGTSQNLLTGATGPVFDVRSTPDGSLVCSAGVDGHVRVWDADSGACLATLQAHSGWIYRLVVWPDATFAASASRDATLAIWDLRTFTCRVRLQGHLSQVRCLALSPDARTLVSGSDDGTARVWDTQTGTEIFTLSGHSGMVSAVLMTPDRRRVVSAGADGTVRVWDAASGMQQPPMVHGASVFDLTATRDGRRVLSAGDDGLLRVWDLVSGQGLATYAAGAPLRVLSAVHPDGRLACGTADGQVQFLHLQQMGLRAPIVTPVRLYRHVPQVLDDDYSVVCPWCGARCPAPAPTQARTAGPALSVVSDDFNEVACSRCQQPLRL